MNVPVMLLLLTLAPFLVPESRDPEPRRIDMPSVILSLAGITLLTYGVKSFATNTELNIESLTFFAGIILLATFVIRQLRIPTPMINVRLFRVRSFSGAVITDLLSVFSLVGAMFALTQFLQLVAGLSVIDSALWMLPQAAATACAGFIAAALVKRFPTAVIVGIAMLITAGGFALLLTLTPDTKPWQIAIALCLIGGGAGMGLTLTNDLIMSSVQAEQSGQAAAISETAYELGTAFGTAVLGSMLLSFYRNGLADTAPAGLPEQIVNSAKEALASALMYAQELPAEIGASLAAAASESFTTALAATGGIAALILLAVSLFAGVMLRGVSAHADPSQSETAHDAT